MDNTSDIKRDVLDVTFVDGDTIEFSTGGCDSLDTTLLADVISVELTELVYVGGGGQIGLLHIEESFGFVDVNEPLVIGVGQDGRKAVLVTVSVTEEFDGDLQLTVGTDAAQAILMTLTENDPSQLGSYSKETNLDTGPADIFKAFFSFSSPPTSGAATITILYN